MELLNSYSYTEVEKLMGISKATLTRRRREYKALKKSIINDFFKF
jgi:uncharacterized protein (DUF2384 family)